MPRENALQSQSRQNRTWFSILLLLDSFVVGGLAVWWFVLRFLETAQRGFVTSCGEIFHVLDKVSLYWVGHVAVAFVLVVSTAVMYLILKVGKREPESAPS